MAMQNTDVRRKDETAYITKRNPYLVDFEIRRNQRRNERRSPGRQSELKVVGAFFDEEEDMVRIRPRRREAVQEEYDRIRPRRRETVQEEYDQARPRRREAVQEEYDQARPRRREAVQEEYDRIRPRRREAVQEEYDQARPRRREAGQEEYDRTRPRRREGDREDGGRIRSQNSGSGRRTAADLNRSSREAETDPTLRRQLYRQAARARRRRRALMQRTLVGIWALCIVVLAAALIYKNSRVAAGETGKETEESSSDGRRETPQYSGAMVQGIPAEEYAKHPDWTEDFLTPNEYSRPGDALNRVDNIFVHYTANPGTSAAQNRSYFEWLKDTHETSASAHFIIGYEGEIIQCIPLDEIAYAVQSRNEDSISIECCYLEEDGSFTQETYDSLLSLLAWLTDTYHLETEDILRHYDCGGKKCPLYYTENPDAWEELKKDVDKL